MRRLDSLDGVRGVLAVYVLLGHMAPFALLPGWLRNAMSHGGAAVDLFFALSGLVITQSLLHAANRPVPFLIARIARIFPVFLAVFAAAVAVAPLSCGFQLMPWITADSPVREICSSAWPPAWVAELAAHLTMTHGLFPNAVLPDVWISFLGAAWSLSAEWQFYLLALLAARHGRRLCWILMGLAVAGAGWRLMAPDPWQFSRAFLPNKGHFFALGVASVGVVRLQEAAWRRYWLVFAATLALCATQGAWGKMMPPLAWTGLLAIQAAPANGALHAAGALLRSATARYLGAISYCLYLVNEPIHKLIAPALARLAGGDGRLFTAMWLPAAVGLPIAAAVALHVWLEAPALRWGRSIARRFVPDQRRAIVQSAGPSV